MAAAGGDGEGCGVVMLSYPTYIRGLSPLSESSLKNLKPCCVVVLRRVVRAPRCSARAASGTLRAIAGREREASEEKVEGGG